MKTVTMCGSIRFAEKMKRISFKLETEHHLNVIQCTYNEDSLEITKEKGKALSEAHYEKIKKSDAIFVVDINEYIGKSVSEEINFAKSLGKEIIYYSKWKGEQSNE